MIILIAATIWLVVAFGLLRAVESNYNAQLVFGMTLPLWGTFLFISLVVVLNKLF